MKGGNPYFVKRTGEYTPEGKYYIEEGTKWRAYPTPAAGAAGYWKLIGGRYKKALQWMAAGDPTSATVALGMKGYFTANIRKYAKAVNSIYKEFVDKIMPQMPDLKSEAAPAPGPKPEVKDWVKDYSKAERSSILSSEPGKVVEMPKPKPKTDDVKEVDQLISQLYSAASKTDALVVVKSNDTIEDKIEFARVAAKILREFVDADVSIHNSDNEVELQCSASGSEEKVVNAINALCECVAYKMKMSFGSDIKALVFPSLISKHGSVNADKIVRNRRKFVMLRMS